MENVILYGAGSDLEKILVMIKELDVCPVCIVDKDAGKIGKTISGLLVAGPKAIKEHDVKTIIITSSFFDCVYQNIQEIIKDIFSGGGYQVLVAPYAWLMLVNVRYDQALLDSAKKFVNENRNKILEIYDTRDKKTKEILSFILRARAEGRYAFYEYTTVAGMQNTEGYFYEGELSHLDAFTFADCGAYTGDTFESIYGMYAGKLKKYYAYEPSEKNFKRLKRNAASLVNDVTCICVQKAIGDFNKMVTMGKCDGDFGVLDGADSREDTELVEMVSLDSEQIRPEGKLVIKIDAEGAEMDILRGAVHTIRKYSPYMAVCVYHRVSDILKLPEFFIEQGLSYRFLLRSGIHTHLLAIPME